MQLIEDSDRETPSKNSATAKEAEKQSRQSKRDAKKEAEAKRVANRETMVREKKQQAVVASASQRGNFSTRRVARNLCRHLCRFFVFFVSNSSIL